MSVSDVLQRDLDAGGRVVRGLGLPERPGDATYTDNKSPPRPAGPEALAGKSLLAAPADHVHPGTMPMRIVARGITTVASGARVTLATFKRQPGELFPSAGFVFLRDDVAGLTWENEVEGPEDVATYHERTDRAEEVAFRAVNESKKARTIEWASVALQLGPGKEGS